MPSNRNNSQRTVRRGIAVGLVAILVASVVIPMVSARTWTPAYTDGEASATGSGCRLTVARHDRVAGQLHVRGSVCGIGSSEAVARTGSSFTTFSGELLGSFSDSASTETYQKGHLQCLALYFAGDLRSSYEVKIQKWKLVGTTWNLEQEAAFGRVECSPFGGITNVDRTVSGSGFFTFNPGTKYRLTTQAIAKASGIGPGSASADFETGGWPDNERTAVHKIYLPNQAPKSLSRDKRDVFLLASVSGGSTVEGIGCDIDSGVIKTRVTIDGQNGAGESSGSAQGCRSASHRISPALAPGSYTIRTVVTDAEQAVVTDTGTYRSEIIPSLLGATAAGYPDLSQIPESTLGSAVSIELLVNSLGQIRAYRVASDGTVLMSTMGSVFPAPTDKIVAVDYNRVLSIADATISGVSQWSGLVAEATSTSPWWNIVPVGQVDPAVTADPVVEADVSFTALDQVPYRELVPDSESAHDEGN